MKRGSAMKRIFTDVIQFRGSHFEFGRRQAELLKESIVIKNRAQQWKVRQPLFRIDLEETMDIFQRFAPKVWEELLGFRETLDWEIEQIIQEFSGFRVNIDLSGCSIMSGDRYLIRNYDYHPKTYDGRIVVYQPTDGGYSTFGVSHKITGRSDGLNEKGLAMGYTFINRKRPGDGFLCYMIGRLILEQCSSAEEAVDLLKDIPHRGSFSYFLYDQVAQTPYLVETSPRKIEVRRDHACTNHFQSLIKENRYIIEDSEKRLSIMKAKQTHGLEASEAFKLLNDTDKGVFSKLYGSWAGTIHTSAYFPNDLSAWFTLGGDRAPVLFDFLKWLNGEDFQIKRIDGTVDTNIPFLNMEKADWFR